MLRVSLDRGVSVSSAMIPMNPVTTLPAATSTPQGNAKSGMPSSASTRSVHFKDHAVLKKTLEVANLGLFPCGSDVRIHCGRGEFSWPRRWADRIEHAVTSTQLTTVVVAGAVWPPVLCWRRDPSHDHRTRCRNLAGDPNRPPERGQKTRS
jgi:hypothetical protein